MENGTELLGWAGTFLLAVCGLPQLIKSFREGHSRGISWLFILAWFWGEVFFITYLLINNRDPILLFNYTVNLGFSSGILYYKIFPRKEANEPESHSA